MKDKNIKIYKKLFLLLLIILLMNLKKTFGYENKVPNNNELVTIHFIDVGQGDSTFIELNNNKTMLIDGGEKQYYNKVDSYIKKLGYSKIDYVIGTHPHTDHIGSLTEIINNYDIGSIYLPKVSTNTDTYLNLLKSINDKNLKINTAKQGLKIVDDNNLKIEVLSPAKDDYNNLNNYSVVTKIKYFNNSFLFMGDAEKEVEDNLINSYQTFRADVLKAGHHGSYTSSTLNFLNRVQPKFTVISSGSGNKYGHPNDIVLKNLTKIGSKIYRTDTMGDIIITSDGNNIKVNKNN